ncbi:MAG: PASTA domain-containing protein [Flavobacteriales bacterium]|nr:PASTA domain-containing protein [Flavobacteriales bacterium]
MKFLKFLISRTFFIHLSIAVVLTAALIWGTFIYLKSYTRFGESVTVPELKGFKVEELGPFLKDKKLQYVQVDPVYDPKMPKGTVVSQNPEPGSLAKEGRKIYVRINSLDRPESVVPDLVSLTKRGAESKLMRAKLKVGITITEPSSAVGFVIRVEKNGRTLSPGDKLPEWSKVDLVVGIGSSSERTDLPNFVGLNLDESEALIGDKLLSVVPVLYQGCETALDSSKALVFRQNPDYEEGASVYQGQVISLWMTCGSDSIPDTTSSAARYMKKPIN